MLIRDLELIVRLNLRKLVNQCLKCLITLIIGRSNFCKYLIKLKCIQLRNPIKLNYSTIIN